MKRQILLLILFLTISTLAYAHEGSHPGMKMRVLSYNPTTNEYNFSCTIPEASPSSQVDPRRRYAIDPIPQGHVEAYYSYAPSIVWKLNPDNYTQLFHSKAMYHIYCEVQNYSAPPGDQNMATEFHVDLRKTHNIDKPSMYILKSEGTSATVKCDPPDGVERYSINWQIKNRAGITNLPGLANQKIANVTIPFPSVGWDIICQVNDLDTGKKTEWNFPVEVFSSGPMYVPTIEGCVPNEPCYHVDPSGIPPKGRLDVTSTPGSAQVFINEVYKGTTNANGLLSIQDIVPGVYNLVLRKSGYKEISTLVPIATGKTLSRSYTMQASTSGNSTSPATYSNIQGIPISCTGGSITQDVNNGGRLMTCSAPGKTLTVQGWDKPTSSNPQYFELYKQSQTGTGLRICLLSTCISDNGYAKSPNYPISSGGSTAPPPPPPTNGSISLTSNPGSASVSLDGISRGTTDSSGNLMISNVAPGSHSLIVSKTGYVTYSNTVSVTSGQTTNVNVVLVQITSPPPTGNTSTYTNIRYIPATCEGGAVTSDIFNGGRDITCTTSGKSLRIQAWDKPTSTNPSYFEMYKKSETGTGLKICLGTTCISNSGYAKSPNYPITVTGTSGGNTGGGTGGGTTNSTNTTQPPGNSTAPGTCVSRVQDMPATCNGGAITSDVAGGGRQVTCSSGGNSLSISAWNKPDSGTPQYFEMYKKTQSGTGITICLGSTCIGSNGYAKSPTYPICTS